MKHSFVHSFSFEWFEMPSSRNGYGRNRQRAREGQTWEWQRGRGEIVITPFQQSFLSTTVEMWLYFLSWSSSGTRHVRKMACFTLRGHNMTTNHFWYQSMQRWKIQTVLWFNNAPAVQKQTTSHFDDNSYATRCTRILQKYAMRSRIWHYIASFYFLISFDPYCMTELFPTCCSSLSWIGYTSKTYSTNPMRNRAALLWDSHHIRYGLCMFVNVNMMNWIPMMQWREIRFIRF